MSAASQVKLLRLLQENEYFPLGSDVPQEANVRVIAATNRDPQDLKRKYGPFRQDLFYRLCTHHIHLPPLRERRDDLPLLCEHFLRQASQQLHKEIPERHDGLVAALASYDFPGNIRELQSIIYNAVSRQSFEPPEFLREFKGRAAVPSLAGNLPQGSGMGTDSLYFAGNLPSLERACEMLIAEAMRRSGGNQTLAAKMIGISRQTLIRTLKKEQTA